jgi:hypothetical protein
VIDIIAPDADWFAGVHYAEESRLHTAYGKPVPSVTQVIDATGKVDFSRVPPAKLELGRKRGSAAHLAAHFFDIGDLREASVHPEVAPRLDAWRLFRTERNFVPVYSELAVYSHRYRYIGRLDKFGTIERGRRRVLLDLKNGDPNAARADLQLTGYWIALTEQFPDLLDEHVEFWAVELKPDGRYRLCVYPKPTRSRREDRSEFLKAVTDVHRTTELNGGFPCWT